MKRAGRLWRRVGRNLKALRDVVDHAVGAALEVDASIRLVLSPAMTVRLSSILATAIVFASGLPACGSTSEDNTDLGQPPDVGAPDMPDMPDLGPACTPDSCMNDGVCRVDSGDIVCDCSGTGFEGARCDRPATISINFDDNASLGATTAAGMPATANWVNARGAGSGQGDNGTLTALVDSSGATTSVSLTWTCQDVEVTTLAVSGGTDGDRTMMSLGCRAWLGMGDADVTVAGLDTHFPNGYDVVVFVGRGGGFPTDHMADFTLEVGAASITGRVMPTFDGTFDTLTGGMDPGNFYRSEARTEASLVLSMAATGNATLPTAAINGLQLIARP